MGPVPQSPRGTLSAGTRVGRYELLRRLARGGMAELYLARADEDAGGDLCVLKLVLPHLAEDRDFVEMFLREARIAKDLDHPNIAHVTDIGEHEGEPFFVMPFIHGRDLRAIATKIGETPLPMAAALTIARDLAAGLHYVHECKDPDGRPLGLVHRDVSPSNVMVGYDGVVKLVDFGIAKSTEQRSATRTGVLKGKVSYMAPEQCHGRRIDRRTDVFALGILLYELTTGRRLFAGENDFYVMTRIVRGMYARPRELISDYPEGLEAIIERALAVEPGDRYPSTEAFAEAIEEFATERGSRLSNLSLAKFMRDTYGDQTRPAGEDPIDISPTEIRFREDSAPMLRRGTSRLDTDGGARRGNPAHTRIGDIESGPGPRVGPADTRVGAGDRPADTRVGPAQRASRAVEATRVGPADDGARSSSRARRVRDEPPTARLGPAVGIGRRSARGDTVRLGDASTAHRTEPRTLRVVDDDERPVSSVGDIRLDVDGLVAELAAEAPPARVEVHEIEVFEDPTTIARRDDDDDPTEIMVDEDGETVSGGHRPTQHTAIAPAPVATRDDTLPMDSHSQPVLRYPPPVAGSGPSPIVHVPHSGPVPVARRTSPMGWLIVGFIALGLGTITAAAWTYEDDAPADAPSEITPAAPSVPAPDPTPASVTPPAAPPRVPTPAATPTPTVTPTPVPTPAPPIPEEEELTVIEDEPEPADPAPKRRKSKRRRKRGGGKSKLDGMYPSG